MNKRSIAVVLSVALLAACQGGRGQGESPSLPPAGQLEADDPTPTEGLGIFAPVAGRIVYGLADAGALLAVDPSGPSDTTEGPSVADDVASTLARLPQEPLPPDWSTIPFGWSSDGTELLFVRTDGYCCFPESHLYILHADGSETPLDRDGMSFGDAAISPDGTRVVVAGWGDTGRMHVIDAEGGRAVPLPMNTSGCEGCGPTFSPDGTQIAYLFSEDGPAGRHETQVWVMDLDGSDAHEILTYQNDRGSVSGLQWSPAGDRLAIGLGAAIYTFAPDGSDLTKVITGGISPYWSPDGSQIAYTMDAQPSGFEGESPTLAIADADGSNVREFGFAASGPWHPGGEGTGAAETGPIETGPTENREAVSQPYEFRHGQVSFSAARAWDYSVAGWEVIPKMITLNYHRDYEERLVLVADPLPVETGCEDGPASADAEALARSIRSDPDLEATEPVVVSVGGIDALRMDVVAATGASVCRVYPAAQVVAPPPSAGPNGDLGFSGVDLAQGQRMRLYLLDLDLAEGPVRMLAIAIIAPDASFEHLVEAAAPIMASFEFRTR